MFNTSCLSILLCFSKNLANPRAQRMLASAQLLLSVGYLHIPIQAFLVYLGDLWRKQTSLDILESFLLSHVHNSSRYTWKTLHFFPPQIFVLFKTKFYKKECSTSKKTLLGFCTYFCRTTSTWHSAIKWLKFASQDEQQGSQGGSE